MEQVLSDTAKVQKAAGQMGVDSPAEGGDNTAGGDNNEGGE